MSFESKGAYRLVLDLIYMHGGNLPDDARYISGLLGCTLRKWESIRRALIDAHKLVVSGAFLSNYRADKELETLAKLQEKQRENGAKPKNNRHLQKPRLNQSESDTDIKKDILSEYPKKDDDFSAFWQAYPVKKSKPLAERSWAKAVKAHGVETIMDGLDRAKRCDHRFASGFTPHPSTWLNANGFLDDHTGVKINGTASHGPKRGTDAHLRALYEAGMDDANGQHRPF